MPIYLSLEPQVKGSAVAADCRLGWLGSAVHVVADCWLACSSGDKAPANAVEIAWTVEVSSAITASVQRTLIGAEIETRRERVRTW